MEYELEEVERDFIEFRKEIGEEKHRGSGKLNVENATFANLKNKFSVPKNLKLEWREID